MIRPMEARVWASRQLRPGRSAGANAMPGVWRQAYVPSRHSWKMLAMRIARIRAGELCRSNSTASRPSRQLSSAARLNGEPSQRRRMHWSSVISGCRASRTGPSSNIAIPSYSTRRGQTPGEKRTAPAPRQ